MLILCINCKHCADCTMYNCIILRFLCIEIILYKICNFVSFWMFFPDFIFVFTCRLPWRSTPIILIFDASRFTNWGTKATSCNHRKPRRREFALFTYVAAVDHCERDHFHDTVFTITWVKKDMKTKMAGSSSWSQLQQQMVVYLGQLSLRKVQQR